MQHSNEINELAAALSRAQAAIEPVKFDAVNPFLKNKYASLGAIIEASREQLAANGLAIVQLPYTEITTAGDHIGVETIVTHASGQWIGERVSLPLGQEKGKSLAQVGGSIVAYLKRYSYPGVVRIYGEEDTDGNAPDLHGHAPEPSESFDSAAPEPPKRSTPAPAPAPASEESDTPADALEISGFLKTVTSKETRNRGQFRYGLLLLERPDAPDGVWINTFDTTDAATAERLKGKQVRCLYTVNDKGYKDLVRHGIVAA